MKINLPVTGRNVDFAPDANILSTTDLTSAITYANQDFIDISGYTREELLGTPHNLLRHPDMPAAAFAHMWQVLKSGRSWMGMVKNRCKNGDHYWVSAYATPVTRDGVTVEYQSVRTKPDARRVHRAERAYARLRAGTRRARPVVGMTFKLSAWVLGACAATWALGLGLATFPLTWQLLAGTAACAVGVAGVHGLLRPLAQLNQRARLIADNPLSQAIYTGRKDEFGRIEFAMQMLEAQVGAVVGRIGDASQRLSGHAAALVQQLDSSHTSSLGQQTQTDQVAAAINQMAASVAQVAEHALQASRAADQAGSETREGHQRVDESRDAVLRLSEELARATDVIHQLESHSGGARDAVQAMAQSSQHVEASVDQAQRAAAALDGISQRVTRITAMSQQIAAAVEEQSAVSEDINRNIIGIRNAGEVTVSAGQQSQLSSGDVEFWGKRR
eukprot:gene21945-26049_t